MARIGHKHAGGRPSIFSQELAEQIATLLTEGTPLAVICRKPNMPNFSTVYRWERDNEEFRMLLAGAREAGTHFMADDSVRIADDPELDPAHKRVMIDTRLRLIGKWNAKAYGDKVDATVTHRGGVQMVITPEDEKTI